MRMSKRGCVNEVREILENAPDPDSLILAQRADGWTALMIATQQGHVEVMELILAHASNPDVVISIKNNIGVTILMCAAYSGNVDAVNVVFKNVSCKHTLTAMFLMQDVDGKTALMYAAMIGHVNVVKMLIENVSESKRMEMIMMKDFAGYTALMLSVMHSKVSVASELLRVCPATLGQQVTIRRVNDIPDPDPLPETVATAETWAATERMYEFFRTVHAEKQKLCKGIPPH